MSDNNKKKEKKEVKLSVLKERSENFVARLEESWREDVTALESFSDYQKVLGTRLCLKVDQALAQAEKDRNPNNGRPPIKWNTVDLEKLLADAADRIKMGLDAMLPNHIWPVVYWNSKKEKYDVDLRVGYKGEDYYKRKASVHPVKNVRYELVYSADDFTVIKSDMNHEKEGYTFSITDPFNRGDVVGGFGYIEYGVPELNELVIVTKEDFDDAKNVAQSDKFWSKWPIQMMYKTLVHRVTNHIQLDPEKINSTVVNRVEQQEYEDHVESEIAARANKKSLAFDDEPEDAQISEEDESTKISAPKDGGNGKMEPNPGF